MISCMPGGCQEPKVDEPIDSPSLLIVVGLCLFIGWIFYWGM